MLGIQILGLYSSPTVSETCVCSFPKAFSYHFSFLLICLLLASGSREYYFVLIIVLSTKALFLPLWLWCIPFYNFIHPEKKKPRGFLKIIMFIYIGVQTSEYTRSVFPSKSTWFWRWHFIVSTTLLFIALFSPKKGMEDTRREKMKNEKNWWLSQIRIPIFAYVEFSFPLYVVLSIEKKLFELFGNYLNWKRYLKFFQLELQGHWI